MEMPPTTRNVCVYVCELYVNIILFERKEKKKLFTVLFTFSDRQAPNYDSDCIYMAQLIHIISYL